MKAAMIIAITILLAGCAMSQITLKADDGTSKCEAKAVGLFASSMANSKFGSCLERTHQQPAE